MERYLAEYIRPFLPVFAGAAAFVGALAAMPGEAASRASMNPTRSLGPELVSGNMEALWVYLSTPVCGAFLALLCCRCIREPACCTCNA